VTAGGLYGRQAVSKRRILLSDVSPILRHKERITVPYNIDAMSSLYLFSEKDEKLGENPEELTSAKDVKN